MNIERMRELRRIAQDGQTPVSLRLQASAKYEAELDLAVLEFNESLAKIKCEAAATNQQPTEENA